MKWFTLICCILLKFCVWIQVSGQSSEIPQTVRKGVIYKKEKSFDLAIQTNGYYLGYNIGKIHKYNYSTYFHIDLGHLKDPREQKVNQNSTIGNYLGNYIYGKQNDLWNIRIGRGVNRYFSEKSRKRGVAISMRAEAGLLIGLLKPYYLQVNERQDNINRLIDIRFSDERKEQFLSRNDIKGASGFAKGLGELNIKPGAFGRIGLGFDPGAYEKYVRAIVFGVSLDVYSGRVPIMATEKNSFLFANFFFNLQFGKRK
ncbi:MAG: hypothetical protein IT267_08140 [Saprospiraceae bacterium]|nr:hypothetical protein [Saprospiraceae bacterium]